jgi:hypothetical protein
MPSAMHVHLQLRIVGHDGMVFTDCEILRLVKRGLPRDWGVGFRRHPKANVEACSGIPLIAGTPNLSALPFVIKPACCGRGNVGSPASWEIYVPTLFLYQCPFGHNSRLDTSTSLVISMLWKFQ